MTVAWKVWWPSASRRGRSCDTVAAYGKEEAEPGEATAKPSPTVEAEGATKTKHVRRRRVSQSRLGSIKSSFKVRMGL